MKNIQTLKEIKTFVPHHGGPNANKHIANAVKTMQENVGEKITRGPSIGSGGFVSTNEFPLSNHKSGDFRK